MGATIDLRSPLARGLEALGVALPPPQVAALLGYLALLARWNAAYNLTAVREPAEMVPRHLLDSLSIRPWVRGSRLLDVGTGPGLPVLLDANGKKVRFCRQAALELGLRNVEVVQARVEAYIPALPFDTLTARAVADLPSLLASVGHLLGPRTTLLAMKGALPAAEVELLRQEGLVVTTHRLDVPGVGGERHLIQIGRRGSDG